MGNTRLDYGQPLTPLATPGLQDRPTTTGTHSRQKTVLPLPGNLFRLISPLWHIRFLNTVFLDYHTGRIGTESKNTQPGLTGLSSLPETSGESYCLRQTDRGAKSLIRSPGTNPTGNTDMFRNERQESQVPRPLYRPGQNSLVLGTDASPAAGLNFTPIADVTAELGRVLIVDCVHFIPTEKTDPAFRWVLAATPPRFPRFNPSAYCH
jgi:hypothetical protein